MFRLKKRGVKYLRKFLGTLIIVIALLVGGATSSMAASSTYTVKKGDSLSKIANTYNVSVSKLKSMNNLKSNVIHPKQKLKLTGSVKASSTKKVNTKAVATKTYKVKKGDSLSKIAKAHNTSVSKLKSLNGLKSNLIRVNQTLKVTGTVKASTPSRSNTGNVAREFYVSASAYTANCSGCSGITKTGINLKKNPNLKVIAVDPKVIKLGSKVHVEGYGYAVAGDTGGAIKGNKIDVFFPSKNTAYQWGRKQVKIKVLN
jgi:3D (Asp-Asp-Asp) domain-containing protein